MVARKRTKSKRAKPARKSTATVYQEHFPATLYMLVVECGFVNRQGGIAWKKVAKALHVSVGSLENWRNPCKEDLYKPEFAQSVKESLEAIDAGNVKRDAITAAGRHFKHKAVREIVVKSPMRVRATYGRKELVLYAAKMLKPPLILDPRSTKPAMMLQIDMAIEKQTKRKLTKVRTESQECMGESAARALVVANVGPEDERWVEKKEHKFTGDKLTDEDREAIRKQLAENQA